MFLKIFFLFSLLSLAQSAFVIQDTTVGGKLAAKRIENTNSGKEWKCLMQYAAAFVRACNLMQDALSMFYHRRVCTGDYRLRFLC